MWYLGEKGEESEAKVSRQISDFNWPILYQRELGIKTTDSICKEDQ